MILIKKILVSLLIALFGTCLALAAVEILFRIIESRTKPVPWNDRPVFYFQHEGSPTLQDYPYSPVKPHNTFRIAVIGDSFSFAP